MEEKIKYKYLIYIPALFIIGCFLFIWGISMTSEGYENRKNLKRILHEDTFDLNKISERKYISLSDYNVYGIYNNGRFFPSCYDFITTKENLYYVAEIYNGKEAFAIPVQSVMPFGLEGKDPFQAGIDNTGHSEYKVTGKIEKTDETALELTEQVAEEHGLNKLLNHTVVTEYKIVIVDVNEEKDRMRKGLWILFAAVLLIAGSRPWKMIQKIEIPLQKSFQYIYEKEYDDRDLRVIGEEARILRANIKCLERQYSAMRKAVVRNSIWGLIFMFVCFLHPVAFEIYILCMLFITKMIFGWLRLFLNKDLKYSRWIMHLFQRVPVKENIRLEQEKLERCDALLDMIYQVV
ncbi:MAG: hypothetical protein HFI34_08965 [Lachnospiraceae bacterium]|nr:hypothetical protein [Lachnospiraceae bacterium]